MHTKISIVIYLYIQLSICILLLLIYLFFLILLFIVCVFCSFTVILLQCGSFCHVNKFLVCVNIPANKAHSYSDSDKSHPTAEWKKLILKDKGNSERSGIT